MMPPPPSHTPKQKNKNKHQQQHVYITTLYVLMMTAKQLDLICVSEERFAHSRLSFRFKQDSHALYMYQHSFIR